MSVHICRDFLSEAQTNEQVSLYLTAMFLYGVMNFTIVGDVSFNLTGSGFMVSTGSGGSINLGSGQESYFAPDTGSYTVSASDIDRILVVRSTSFSRLNSGLFRVVGVNTGSNAFVIDYRSTGNPPMESGTLPWKLFESETNHTAFNNTSNGSTTTYAGTGSATTSRITLQSPDATAWQVRLCWETTQDDDYTGTKMSIAPGFNANEKGDFAPYDQHLHGIQWHDVADSSYRGSTVGFNGPGTAAANTMRFYMWGEQDATPGSFVLVGRNTTGETGQILDCWAAFGFCEDEQAPLPTFTIQRMFAMGNMSVTNGGVSNITWSAIRESGDGSADTASSYIGVVAFGEALRPNMGSLAAYTTLTGKPGASGHPKDSAVAGDSTFSGATDLIPVDVMSGVYKRGIPSVTPRFYREPRRIGRFPLARMGRSNYADWTPSTDAGNTWFHARRGIYLPWSGSVVP